MRRTASLFRVLVVFWGSATITPETAAHSASQPSQAPDPPIISGRVLDAAVVSSTRGAAVNGRVVGERGEPVIAASVAVNHDATCYLEKRPPGDYLVAVASRLQSADNAGDWQDRDVLEPLRSRAIHVSADCVQTIFTTLKAVPR